jgi:hypothetical protein
MRGQVDNLRRLNPLDAEEEIDTRFRFIRIETLRSFAADGCEQSAERLRWELNEYRLDLVDALRLDPGEYPKIRESYRAIGSRQRAAIYARDGRQCGICKRTNVSFEIDHKVPFSRGGSHHPDNLWVLCLDCNQAKGAMTVEEYLALVEDYS